MVHETLPPSQKGGGSGWSPFSRCLSLGDDTARTLSPRREDVVSIRSNCFQVKEIHAGEEMQRPSPISFGMNMQEITSLPLKRRCGAAPTSWKIYVNKQHS
mmetsp:Transcript_59826/g.177309  ORF Transcript_59826/g.177309 Transcript_59826/m.177309 type:complete len:101 (-) Transcript_59826:292-594(-)